MVMNEFDDGNGMIYTMQTERIEPTNSMKDFNHQFEIIEAQFILKNQIRYNDMNQWHNCIQGGKLGWKEGAD